MKKLSYLFLIASVVLLTGCSAFFQPRVPMDFDSANASLEDLLVEKKKGGKLGTPAQLMVSKNADPSTINLTWTAVPNAVAYRIECAIVSPDAEGNYVETVPEEQFNILEKSWYGLNYKHKITESALDDYENRYEKRYFYKVTAINARDGYDDGDSTAPNIYGTLFAPPRNVKASTGAAVEYVDISWDFVDGAKEYKILRSESENGSGAGYISTVLGNKNSYRDMISPANQGKEFYYIIYAVNKNGTDSNPSSLAMGYSLVPGAPACPSTVTLVEGRGDHHDRISLSWSKVESEGDVKYNVFRYSSKDTALTRVGKDLKVTTFTDSKNLEPGIFYTYFIQTSVVETNGDPKKPKKSPFSKSVQGFILSPPENIRAKKAASGVELTWDKAIGTPEEQAIYKYKIFVSNELEGNYEEKLTLTDTKANVGSYKFFKIKTVNKAGKESADSEVVSPAPDGVSVVNVTHADYKFLTSAHVANDAGVYPVKITWEKPATDNPYGYHIYRSTKEDSGYRKISEAVVQAPNTTYIDADETLQPGKVYYYKVLSLNSLEKGENFSNPNYGWGALTHERYLKEFNETIASSQKKLTLMHKPGNTDKLGSETKSGTLSGSVYYNAAVQGLGAYITMKYSDYADFYINPAKKELGKKFVLNGNSDTSANMSSNGTMNGIISCSGMYPGKVDYNSIQIKSGAAGGGSYGVIPEGLPGKKVPYYVLEE